MKEAHRVRRGLNEWNRPPLGYVEISANERVQAGDVQKIHDELYLEYPAGGLLVGKFRGVGGTWYRKPARRTEAFHDLPASEICHCNTPLDNDLGVCMGCGGHISPRDNR